MVAKKKVSKRPTAIALICQECSKGYCMIHFKTRQIIPDRNETEMDLLACPDAKWKKVGE